MLETGEAFNPSDLLDVIKPMVKKNMMSSDN
jgi:hypothetical protein